MATVAAEINTADETTPADQPDFLLLARFTDTGDPAAFAQIVNRYAGVVYSASFRILRDEGKAQDISQETFFRLMRQPKLVTQSLGGWLHRSATHLALDVRRSERARRRREHSYGIDHQPPPKAQATWAEVSPYVDEALNEIEEPTRTLLIRHYLQGISQADMAAEIRASPATMSRRIKGGLEQLQQLLQKKGIYLGLAALAGFCFDRTTEAAPPAFFAELGKMNLIASFKEVGFVSQPAATWPQLLKMRWQDDSVSPVKYVASFIVIMLLIAAYSFAVVASFSRANPVLPQTEFEQQTNR